MEEDFFHLHADILTQQHESDHLKRREMRELAPFDVEVEKVCALLLFLSVGTDLLDSAIDEVLCVAINGAQVLSSHHFVVLRNASIALFLILEELLPQQLE